MAAHVEEIVDSKSGSRARILVSLGFNCFSWQPALSAGPREMLWSGAEFELGDKRPSSGGIPLLFPFPGRIGDAKFHFGGQDYQLEPGDAFGNAIHGFVFNRPWRIVERSDSKIVGEFHASIDDPSILKHWPADFRISVSYEVRASELISDIRYENTGDGPLPCGFATHAYFHLPLSAGQKIDDTTMKVPVDSYWELEKMIPTGRILPAEGSPSLRDGVRLGDLQFDTVFTNLHADPDGFVRTTLSDPATGRTLTQVFDKSYTQCVVYTPGHREAVCMEPYTCVPNAIQLADKRDDTGLQILQHGEIRDTTIRISVSE
jgi:aldose 1-epimerase